MIRDDYPKPVGNADSEMFWRFCKAHELRVQRCNECGVHRYFPRPRCPSCRSASFEWARCSGDAVIHSYTICHPPVLPAFAERAPYNVIVVQLEEGPFMVSNLVGGDDGLRVGLAVEVCFTDIDDELTIPQFRQPTAGAGLSDA
jgi:uncharacterized protein